MFSLTLHPPLEPAFTESEGLVEQLVKGAGIRCGLWNVVFSLKISRLISCHIKLSVLAHACDLQVRKLRQEGCDLKAILVYTETLPT